MTNKPSLLIIEDTAALMALYRAYLEKEGDWEVFAAQSIKEAKRVLQDLRPAVILLDMRLPDGDGLDFLREIKAMGCDASIVVMTAFGSVKTAVEAIRAGAYDFLVKPFDSDRLRLTLGNARETRKLKSFVASVERKDYFGMIGSSLVMQALYRQIEAAAQSKATVFVTGESGAGKEEAAQAIHRQSPRAARPFVALNCAAIPRDLLESELFGHVKGAFTGAQSDYNGAALRADGGTLFLDEIGEMDLALQAKLLRFLQLGQVQRLGEEKTRAVDVRIIAATNRDPRHMVAEGRLREDLFYRLYVIPLEVPALRERGEDILALARHFLDRYGQEEGKRFDGFDPQAEAALMAEGWPGNVRQLQNVMRNLAVMHPGGPVTREDLPLVLRRAQAPAFQAAPRARAALVDAPIKPLAQVEREAIEAAIAHCGGNINQAAVLLGVNPSTLYRKRAAWADARASA